MTVEQMGPIIVDGVEQNLNEDEKYSVGKIVSNLWIFFFIIDALN